MTSAGNPISLDLKTRYTVKGINKTQTIESKVNIFHEGEKITKVEDKWNGELPDSKFQDVSSLGQLISVWWWLHYAEGWAWWVWSWTWETRLWQVRGDSVELLRACHRWVCLR